MKRILFCLLLIPALASAQNGITSNSVMVLRGATSDSLLSGKFYINGELDTSQAIEPWRWKSILVCIQSKDSASLHLQVMLSADGITFGPASADVDSLSTASNTGDTKIIDATTACGGAYSAKFLIKQPSTFRWGTSTNTYRAVAIFKRF